MFYVAHSILKDEHLAEDAVHQAFIKIIDNLDKINEITCPKTPPSFRYIGKRQMKEMFYMYFKRLITAILCGALLLCSSSITNADTGSNDHPKDNIIITPQMVYINKANSNLSIASTGQAQVKCKGRYLRAPGLIMADDKAPSAVSFTLSHEAN